MVPSVHLVRVCTFFCHGCSFRLSFRHMTEADVDDVESHPDYDFINDIALLKLSRNLNSNVAIEPIKLPEGE